MIIGAVLVDGLAGLSGGLLPLPFVHRQLANLLAFAAGALLGAAFISMLPEALAGSIPPHEVMVGVLVGFSVFYVIESFIGSHAAGQTGHKHETLGPFLLIGDALHNATDGVAIAAAFIADVKTGIATTIAVVVHELPQELGDYSILISQGWPRNRALFALFMVQMSAFLGAFGALWASAMTVTASPYLLAISAGGFIYIAAADLLPALHRHKPDAAPLPKLLSFCAGLGIMMLLEVIVK
jgi:zinc and cadmium transporter